MSGVNAQYGNRAILDSVFKCKKCSSPLLMFGCDNNSCDNYWKDKI